MQNPQSQLSDIDVEEFVASLEDEQKREDSRQLIAIMQETSGQRPVMWGANMIGFGSYHYKHASGREGDMMVLGFSPRKAAISLYGLIFYEENTSPLTRLGKHKAGKGCLYVKRLADIDISVLKEMIKQSWDSKAARNFQTAE